MKTIMTAAAAVAFTAGMALAGAGDVDSFDDAPRFFNDRPSSNLVYTSDFAGGTMSIAEDNYGAGGWANRHVAWWGDGGSKLDFNLQDSFDAFVTMQVVTATDVAGVEAGFQADLFGLGFFGALGHNGEIAAFGSTSPFHSFGTGLYNVGDVLDLRMVYTGGDGDGTSGGFTVASTMEYLYRNQSTDNMWHSSGAIVYGNLEGGIPTPFDQYFGIGAQINGADEVTGAAEINFWNHSVVPAPTTVALLGLGGLVATRRRR